MRPLVVAAVVAGLVTACGGESTSTATDTTATISHKFGETKVPANPSRVVTVAMANKTARIVWAVLARGEIYRAPAMS